mmetsp:Transcript_10065/g.27591  ORF Transcript_10065/g.27591 Transcript_10065/m.27591 type:complete len:233 (-) Transcript_10065:93-791(-)
MDGCIVQVHLLQLRAELCQSERSAHQLASAVGGRAQCDAGGTVEGVRRHRKLECDIGREMGQYRCLGPIGKERPAHPIRQRPNTAHLRSHVRDRVRVLVLHGDGHPLHQRAAGSRHPSQSCGNGGMVRRCVEGKSQLGGSIRFRQGRMGLLGASTKYTRHRGELGKQPLRSMVLLAGPVPVVHRLCGQAVTRRRLLLRQAPFPARMGAWVRGRASRRSHQVLHRRVLAVLTH